MAAGRNRVRTLLAASLLLGVAACAASSSPQAANGSPPPAGYFAARGRDFSRIFDGQLLFGPGLGVRASVTKWFEAGLLFIGSTEVESRVVPVQVIAVGKRGDEVGSWRVRAQEYGISPWFQSDVSTRPLDSIEPAQRGSASKQRATQLSAQVHLGIVGAELGFDLEALGRFITGLFSFGGDEPPG